METAQSKIMDIINPTMKDVYAIAGVTEAEIIPFKNPANKRQRSANAFCKLSLMIEVVNEGWQADYNDGMQPKYEPIFQFQGSGFGFSHTYYVGWLTYAYVGSPLVFRSAEHARFAGNTFINEYNEFLLNK